MTVQPRPTHLDEAAEALYTPTKHDPLASSVTESVRLHMTGAEWFSAHAGGLNRYFTDLYGALSVHPGVAVSAAAFGEPGPGAQSWGPTGGSTLRRAHAAFFDSGSLPRGAVLDRHFCLYGRPSMGLRGKHPLVLHFHGPWAAESQFTGASRRAVLSKYWLERLRYSGADRFVVLSQHFRNLLVEDYRVAEDKIVVIPPGVDLKRFPVALYAPQERVVLCVRRLERRMGIDVLIRAWRDVVTEHSDARLVIVGTGTEEATLRAQVAVSGLSDSVTFEGRASDGRLAELYQQAALTVVPSVALEGFGLAALESLAAGRAPVVTDCGGLPDAITELDFSLVVPTGDSDALGNRLVDALYGDVPDPARCRRHAQLFSWQAAAQRHVEVYQELSQ